jgi:hypothetical protein
LDDEQRSGRLRGAARRVARANGASPSKKDIAGIVDCVREYVGLVPRYMEQARASALNTGLATQVEQLITQLELYWLEENDFIPDHYGLLGVMDDAYASLTLLQALSEYCRSSVGQPLIADDLTQANQMVRMLLGEPAATILDQQVGGALASTLMPQLVNQLAASQFMLGPASSSQWGGCSSLDEYVGIQLGAMGVV